LIIAEDEVEEDNFTAAMLPPELLKAGLKGLLFDWLSIV
jgi:hypothetical protein